MAIYAIGDIHGSIIALKTIFQQGLINEEDTVVFLGDYIDKGTDSKGVIDWLIEKRKTFNFEFILGNHEIIMTRAKSSTETFKYWYESYGGSLTLKSYKISDKQDWISQIDKAHWDFIDSCLPYFKIGDFIFVHGGLEKNKSLEEQKEHYLFFEKFEKPLIYDPIKTVICGHTARKNGKIANFKHTICIDTYAYGGMWLTCLNVETNEFLKANNKGQIEKGKLEEIHLIP